MALLKAKPTSPGRRFVVKVTREKLHKGKPHAALLSSQHSTGGRNNRGRGLWFFRMLVEYVVH